MWLRSIAFHPASSGKIKLLNTISWWEFQKKMSFSKFENELVAKHEDTSILGSL